MWNYKLCSHKLGRYITYGAEIEDHLRNGKSVHSFCLYWVKKMLSFCGKHFFFFQILHSSSVLHSHGQFEVSFLNTHFRGNPQTFRFLLKGLGEKQNHKQYFLIYNNSIHHVLMQYVIGENNNNNKIMRHATKRLKARME